MPRPTSNPSLQKLPVKWALAIVVALIAYALLQPIVNSRLGWHLPTLAYLMGEEAAPRETKQEPAQKSSGNHSDESHSDLAQADEPKSSKTEPADEQSSQDSSGRDTATKSTDVKRETSQSDKSAARDKSEQSPAEKPTEQKVSSSTKSTSSDKSAATTPKATSNKSSTESQSKTTAEKPKQPIATGNEDSNLKYGMLREVGRDRFVSPAGLMYLPGSEEGHRIEHIRKHMADIPDRPGKHGVFEGDMKQVLTWIDDAYARGKRGAKGVRKTQEANRTVYEAPFNEPIGYIGGRDGARSGNPPAKRIRLVVEGDKVVTAFPF